MSLFKFYPQLELSQIENMELPEAITRLKSAKLRQLDKLELFVCQAFFQRAVNATNEKGKYINKRVEDVFDKNKEIEALDENKISQKLNAEKRRALAMELIQKEQEKMRRRKT